IGVSPCLFDPKRMQAICIFAGNHLLHSALGGIFLRTPAQELSAVAEASSGKVIVLHFTHQFVFEREPFSIAVFTRPAAWASRSFTGESGAAHHGLEDRLQFFARLFAEAGTEAYMIQLALAVIETKQQ